MPSTTRPPAPLFRRLLVGTDFSAGAAGALTRIPFLPLAPRAEISLLHVMPGWINPALHGREVRKAEDRLHRAAARLVRGLEAAGHDGVRVGTMLTQGEPHTEILRRSARADLVVVGRHGRRSFRDLLDGSTAERVVRHAVVPTLVVGGPARSAYRRPVAAVERDSVSRVTLELAARLLEPGRRVLEVVHAYHPAHEAMLARAGTPAGRAAYRRECRTEACRAIAGLIRTTSAAPAVRGIRLRRADPRLAIVGTARARRADLIVVGTHGRTGLAHALMGSVAEAVIRHAACDVLVAPPRRRAKATRRRAA
jgi:nucleotide-binding universal stress UspA family protein